MPARNLVRTSSIDTIWAEVVYTEARLLGDRNATDLAPQHGALLAELEAARKNQLKVWRDEIVAQAQVDGVNDQLDDLVVDFADTLLFTVRDRTSPRFQRYFAKTPYTIVRAALAAEVELVRGWPESLRSEPEDAIKAFATRFDDVLKAASGALESRTRAAAVRADQRVREIEALIDKVNQQRNTLFGDLTKRGVERKLPKTWSESFFRVLARKEEKTETP